MILLGCMEIDGHVIELVWALWSDTVLADFRDVEPRRIGTALIMGRSEPVFVPQPHHLHWLGYEGRDSRILRAAVRLFGQRPTP